MLEEARPDGMLPPLRSKFKEISEKELLAHLKQGWRIVHTLESGRVIVKR